MKRGMKLVLVVFALMASAQAQRPAAPARVWEDKLVIPTYELGPADPNPAFLEWSGGRPVYPYARLDSLTNRRIDKAHNAVYLENEFLRVTVLPEMGGKLYAIYDKAARRDVLYTNHVVKYGIVAIRGAWTSGGIEWNFPDGHTVTTVSPVDYATRSEPDGAAVVFVGDTERIQRMQWQVAIRLRPGRKVVETEVTLNNRRETPGRYWFWATAAAKAADDMRFVYPMREAYPHAFWPVFTFPKYNGVDLGLYREVPNALSLFARNSYRDFLGVYYETSDWGIAHVADHRDVPGKKTWTWGTDDAGSIWVEKLTDADGQYVEFQAGRYETQMEHQFIAPHRVERFTEYWFPLDKLGGGYDEVNRDIALHVVRATPPVEFALNAAQRFENVTIVVEDANGAASRYEKLSLDPERPLRLSAGKAALRPPFRFTITTQEGRELLRYRTDTPVDGNPQFVPATRPVGEPDANSAEQAYLKGVAADKKSNQRAARAAYEEALRRDANFSPARTALGLSYYRSGEHERAAAHLLEALRRDPDSGDAHYYLALVRRAEGKSREAREHLTWCVRQGQHEQIARYVLGEMALAARSPGEAIGHLKEATRLDSRDIKAWTVLGIAHRCAACHAGHSRPVSVPDHQELGAAQVIVDEVLKQAPLDYLALAERYLILDLLHKGEKAAPAVLSARQELQRVLSREPDSVLEVAFDYTALGASSSARSILGMATERAGERAYPIWDYTLSYLSQAGRAAAGEQADPARAAPGQPARVAPVNVLERAAAKDPAFVFPHRLEEIQVLEAAVQQRPRDPRAHLYLGNALAARGRFKEAENHWRAAVQLEPSNAVAQRNLALALAEDGRKDQALEAFNHAIEAAPGDSHLYVERDRLLAGMNRTKERIELLERASDAIRPRVAQVLADAYVRAARHRDAIALLERVSITSGEGESGGLAVYQKAQLGLARELRRAGRHAEAAAAFLKATDYPRNLGVGRSKYRSHAAEYLAAAEEFEQAGNREEAAKWIRRAADEPLAAPTEPGEAWSPNYYYKAVALQRIGRGDEAHALFQRMAALYDPAQMAAAEPGMPRDAIRFLLAGLALKELGQREAAREALKQALQLDPGNELAAAALKQLEAPANR